MEETRTIRALCPKCTSSVPKLTLVGNSLYIKCDCGKNENAPLPLSDYLSQLKSQPDRKVSFKTTCAKHQNKKYQFCCIECSSSLCEQCQSEHKCKENLQNAIFPMELIQYTYLNNLPRNIKNAEGIISSYFPTLKEQYLKEEKDPEKINKFTKAYEKAVSESQNIIEFITILMECYEPDNGCLVTTLKDLSGVDCDMYIEGGDSESLLNYFEKFSMSVLNEDKIISEDAFERVTAMAQLRNGNIALGNEKGKIIILDAGYKIVKEISIKGNLIYEISQLDNDIIVSASEKELTFLSADYQVIKTIEKNQNKSQFSALSNNRIAAFVDSKIKIFDCASSDKFSEIATLDYAQKSENVMTMLYVKEKNLLITADNEGIRVWDMTTYKQKDTMELMKSMYPILSLVNIDGNKIFVGSVKGALIYNIEKNDLEQNVPVRDEGYYPTSAIVLRDKQTLAISGKNNKMFKYNFEKWNVWQKEIKKNEEGQNGEYAILKIDDSTFITNSCKKIYVWKY